MHTEHEEAIEALHSAMIRRSADGMSVVKSAAGPKDVGALNHLDELLWQAVIACQNNSLRTASGLPFSYTVKRKKDGTYSGELLVSHEPHAARWHKRTPEIVQMANLRQLLDQNQEYELISDFRAESDKRTFEEILNCYTNRRG